MKRVLTFSLASILALFCTSLAHGQDYQKIADETAWKFSPEQASVTDSFLRFSKDYQVELIRPKNKFGEITIRVVNDGKEVVALGAPRGGQFKDWFSALPFRPISNRSSSR